MKCNELKNRNDLFYNSAFYLYISQLTLQDLVYAVPLHPPHCTGVDIPAAVSVLLALGNKYIMPTQLQPSMLAKRLHALSRKVRLKYYWSQVKKSTKESQPAVLPAFKQPSDFDPLVPPALQRELSIWQNSILSDAYGVRRALGPVRTSVFIRYALIWLRTEHSRKSICKIEGDKGYGPVVVHHAKVHDAMRLELSSGGYEEISMDAYVARLMDAEDFLRAQFNRAVDLRLITRATQQYVCAPFENSYFYHFTPQNTKLIEASLGRI